MGEKAKVLLQDIIMQVDSLIVHQWEINGGTLRELNQLVYAGAATVVRCSKRQGAKSYENQLKKSIECKRRKVSGANSRLSKLASELKRRRNNQKMTRRQKNNIKRLKLHGVNNMRLSMLIAKQTELVKIKQAHLAKRLKYKQANSLYQKFGVSSLMPKRNPKVEVRREARREFRKYWKGVIGVEGDYKSDNEH